MARQRHELHSTGFNPFLQLVGGDSALTPNGTGLVVPVLPGLRYRMLLSVVDLDAGDALCGIRTYTELWALKSQNGDNPLAPPFYVFKLPVRTPGWFFIDGFQTFTLTCESTPPASHRYNALEQWSFAYEDSTSPACVFETATIPAVGGGALPGYVGLTAYTPPGMRGIVKLCWRDNQRFPWERVDVDPTRYIAKGSERWRLYCDVLQTDPGTRFNPNISGLGDPTSLCPEDVWVLGNFPTSAQYGLVAASLVVEQRNRRKVVGPACGIAEHREREGKP